MHLVGFSNNETSSSVGDLDVEFLGTLDNQSTSLGRDAVSDFSSIDAVLHHQHFEFSNVVDQNLAETGGQHVTSGLGGTVTDLGHGGLATEATTDAVVDTLGFAPAFLDGFEAVGLVTLEGLGTLLDDARLRGRRHHTVSSAE